MVSIVLGLSVDIGTRVIRQFTVSRIFLTKGHGNHTPDKEGRSELGFALAPLETDPATAVTRSSEVSRGEPASAMVTRSRAREGRGISVIPETQFEPEIETRPEQEMQISMPTTCEGGKIHIY